jgi:hypothetical protein
MGPLQKFGAKGMDIDSKDVPPIEKVKRVSELSPDNAGQIVRSWTHLVGTNDYAVRAR